MPSTRGALALAPMPATMPSRRIARFTSRHLIHGKGQFAGEPFVLEGWQATDLVEPVYDSLHVVESKYLIRRVTEGLVGVGKKNGKTHIAAALGLYGLVADGYWRRDGDAWVWVPEYGAEVYNVAGSGDQARVLFDLALGFVNRSPFLRAMCRTYKDAIEFPETESVWRVLASDGKLAHGPNPSTAIIDEIWTHRNPDLYEALSSAGAARRQPLVLTITTAGFNQEAIAYRLYRRGIDARRPDPTFHFRWFEAQDTLPIDSKVGWKQANPSRWVTPTYLKSELNRQRKTGSESEFRRWHLNQWTGGAESAIPVALWDGNDARPRIPKGGEVMVAVDAAPKKDTTAIAVVHRDAKGYHHVRVTIMKADPDTGYLDFTALEDLLRELCQTYEVHRILVDPFNMIRSMVMLQEEGLPIVEFNQGDARMVPVSHNLYELLIEKRLRHGGAPALRAQILNAGKKETARGWRLHKLKSAGKIDAAQAVAIACFEWERELLDDELPLLVV